MPDKWLPMMPMARYYHNIICMDEYPRQTTISHSYSYTQKVRWHNNNKLAVGRRRPGVIVILMFIMMLRDLLGLRYPSMLLSTRIIDGHDVQKSSRGG